MKVTVVIPAYNEEATIAKVVADVAQHASSIIVVNDGSSDRTVEQLAGLPAQLINHETNLGKAASLLKGIRAAMAQGADAVITLDGDGQHPPAHIPELIAAALEHPRCIIVAARLKGREAAPPMRRFANGFADFWISWAAGQRMVDTQSGFRFYPAELFERVHPGHERRHGFVMESEVLIDASHAGFRSMQIPIETIYPEHRRASHYRPLQDTAAIVRMVAGKLVRRGFYPVGLLKSLMGKSAVIEWPTKPTSGLETRSADE